MKDRAVSETKQRLLRAGEQLFRTQGYAATGLKQLTQAADAPWGSLYHFFPDGKEQMGAEIVAYAGDLYRAGLQAALERFDDPAEAIERIFVGEAAILDKSDYRDGCPVASVTLDVASTNESLRAACASAFRGWLETIALALSSAGAIVLSRAAKNPAPLLQSAKFVRQAVEREAKTWTRARRASRKRS